MNDIVISSKRQKKELFLWSVCFIISFMINAIAIIIYDTQWKELFTHIGYVFFLSFILYGLLAVLRLIKFTFYSLIVKKKK